MLIFAAIAAFAAAALPDAPCRAHPEGRALDF